MKNKIPNYTIEREIGEGGMATVYLAVQDMLHRYVAIKVMRPELTQDKNFRQSFLSEGSTIANLEHSNIIRIYDIGITDDTVFYMAMEYLSGGNLKERLDKGKLSYSHTIFILEEVANGLAYAHKKGYIHRDIKPANILFRDDGIAVLSDFGLAKLQDSSGELTRLGFTKGTIQYMSPEQAITTDLDQRSDIYSLGLVFYEMLTGDKAFLADSTIQAIHQHTAVEPPSFPAEYAFLQPILDKVLAKNPDQRYQTVADFLVAIKTVVPLQNPPSQSSSDKSEAEIEDITLLYPSPASEDIPAKVKNKKTNFFLILTSLFVLLGSAFGMYQYSPFSKNTTDINASEKITLAQLTPNDGKEKFALADQNQKNKEQIKQDELAKQKVLEEKEFARQKVIDDRRLQEAKEIEKAELEAQKVLDKERKKEEKKAKDLEIAKQKALDEEQLKEEKKAKDLEIAKQKALDEEQLKEGKKAKKLELDKQKKLAKKKAIKRKKAEKEKLRKANIAKEKARKRAREKEIAKKQREEKKIAEKKAKEQQKKKQNLPAKNQAQIKVSVTLDGRPLKTYIMITKRGKRLQVAKGKSFAVFNLPAGQYTISANYNGKKATAIAYLEEGDIVIQKLSFKKLVQKKNTYIHPHTSPNYNTAY